MLDLSFSHGKESYRLPKLDQVSPRDGKCRKLGARLDKIVRPKRVD